MSVGTLNLCLCLMCVSDGHIRREIPAEASDQPGDATEFLNVSGPALQYVQKEIKYVAPYPFILFFSVVPNMSL